MSRFTENVSNWAAGIVLAVVLGIAPTCSQAFGAADALKGALGDAVQQQIAKRVGDYIDRPAPVALPAPGSFTACRHLFPAGAVLNPASVNAAWRATALCSSHFAVLYSGTSKTPLVVVERLGRAQLADALDEQRTNEFYPDPRLPRGARAELEDFQGSGMDRGHMAPAGDQPDQASMAQSFALSNMVPQDPVNNRKVWSKVESDVRKFARRAQGNVYVFSGPIFRGQPRTVGRNQVWVPSHLFKLVYDEASGRSWAHILENSAESRVEAPMDYGRFVAETGWQLLSPAVAARVQ